MEALARPGECFSCTSKLCRFARHPVLHGGQQVFNLSRGDRIESCAGACVKFWTVLSGTAAICTALKDGRRQITGVERSGSTICGPMAHEDSPTWLEALEPAQICEIDLSSEINTLQDEPGFMQVMFEVIHTRLEVATRHLTTLGRLDSTERVTLFLAETAALAPGHGPVQLPMSREDIADYLGLNAETVSRILSKLKKAGLFTFLAPTEYVVPDMAAVARRLPVQISRKPHKPIAAIRALTVRPGADPVARCPVIHDTETAS